MYSECSHPLLLIVLSPQKMALCMVYHIVIQVLVHCRAGVNRSGATAVAYVMVKQLREKAMEGGLEFPCKCNTSPFSCNSFVVCVV